MNEALLGKVVVAFPSSGHDISSRWLRSLVEMDVYDRERGVALWEQAGCPEHPNPVELRLFHNYLCVEATANLAKARNRLVDEFLTNEAYAEAQWLWFLDADMVWEPDLMHRMVARAVQMDLRVLGGLCVIVTADGPLTTLFAPDDDTVTQVLLDWPEGTVCEVAATGTGCLMVHRSVLEEMRQKSGSAKNAWFGFDVVRSRTGKEWALGEDISFCLRLQELTDHKVYVDTTAHVGHHKGPKVWWPETTRTSPVNLVDLHLSTVDENIRA